MRQAVSLALVHVFRGPDKILPHVLTAAGAGCDVVELVVNVLSGQTYAIAVDGYGGAAGSVQLSVKLGPPVVPPSAPAWATVDPFGAAVASSNYAGKVVIFNFWATWYGPCLAEMPDFVALQEKYRRDGLVIVGPMSAIPRKPCRAS